jgi:proliferating cell nuclear antigen PCNA
MNIIVFKNTKKFISIWKLIEAFSFDLSINIQTNSFETQTMDNANSSLFDWKMKPDEFEVFDIKTPYILGVSIPNMIKILKDINENTKITWKWENSDILTIILDEANSYYEFELKLLEIETELFELEDEAWDYISIPSKKIKKDMLKLKSLSSEITHIFINYNKKYVNLSVISDTANGSSNIIYNEDSDDGLVEKKSKYSYQITLLSKIVECFDKITDTVKFGFQDNRPLFITLQNEFGNIKIYISPRVDED